MTTKFFVAVVVVVATDIINFLQQLFRQDLLKNSLKTDNHINVADFICAKNANRTEVNAKTKSKL